jgi:hypothetical protein
VKRARAHVGVAERRRRSIRSVELMRSVELIDGIDRWN